MKASQEHHVDGQLVEVSIELGVEVKAGGDTTHGDREKVVQVPMGSPGHREGAETDVIKGLIINAVGIISIFLPIDGQIGW